MHSDDGGEETLAPVIPLFGAVPEWNNTWAGHTDERASALAPAADAAGEEIAAAGEATLLRKLRTRSLSEREARDVLAGCEVDEGSREEIIARFIGNGYLDDARLADQLLHSGIERKSQGRSALARSLAQRGIARDVIDDVLAALPDDEFARALEFARTKARAMRGLERDVALRRLSGQLARRGYGGLSLEAARRALDENAPTRGRGVRFEP